MRVDRNWGYYTVLLEGDGYLVKELTIHPDRYLSNQRHQHRTEEWLVVSGSIEVKLNDEMFVFNEGDKFTISPKVWHHIGNVGSKDAKVIEVWMGDILDEKDIERK